MRLSVCPHYSSQVQWYRLLLLVTSQVLSWCCQQDTQRWLHYISDIMWCHMGVYLGSKDSEVEQLISAFKSYYRSAEVYHVFHAIQRFTVSTCCLYFTSFKIHIIILQDQPFTYRHPEALFNMALFLTHLDNNNSSKKYKGVSRVYPLWNSQLACEQLDIVIT